MFIAIFSSEKDAIDDAIDSGLSENDGVILTLQHSTLQSPYDAPPVRFSSTGFIRRQDGLGQIDCPRGGR
jgi:hypothetical protein